MRVHGKTQRSDAEPDFEFQRMADDGDIARIGYQLECEKNGWYFFGFGVWNREQLDPTCFGVCLPQWFCALTFLILPMAWLRHWKKTHRKGHCPICGYDLRASAGACPECGKTIA